MRGRLWLTAAISVGLICFCQTPPVLANLLSTIELSGGLGYQSSPGDVDPRTAFALVYDPNLYFPVPNDTCIGCNYLFSPGTYTNVSIDFTPLNSPNFDAFANLLTNTTDDVLWIGNTLFTAIGVGGFAASGGPESLNLSTFLAGPSIVESIDLIRLTLTQFEFSPGNLRFEGLWEIYGTPGPDFPGPKVIPEPNTAPLLMTGLLLLWWSCRFNYARRTSRRRRKQ